jgi:protein phosphatase
MAEANPDMRFMATTLVTAAFRNGAFAVASVGDSPAFLVRDGQIRKLTTDHTFAEMQFRAGRLTHDEAWLHPDRHKLVRALGRLDEIEVDVITEPVQIGDCLLLCSDGLTRYVLPGEMLFLLKTNPLNQAAPALVARANERGGSDNISLIAIQVLPDEIEVETSPGSDARVETSLSRPPRLRRLRRLGLALTATLTAVLGVIEIRGSAKRGAK